MIVSALQPLIRLPAPFPRSDGEKGYAAPSPSHVCVGQGTSPLPARGERARVRGRLDSNDNGKLPQ